MASADLAGPVRPGEELDVAAVDAWLKKQFPHLAGTPRVTQFSGGASNWTYRLEYASDDLVLRRPPAGTKAKSAHDVLREARIQQALAPVFPHVPEILALCDDPAIIGCPFYVMRRIDGVILRSRIPAGMTLDAEAARRLCLNFVDTLAALHRVDIEHAGLSTLGKGTGYARRQVEGWSDRYRKARTWRSPRCENVMTWLAAHVPEDSATCMIHNDFRLDNLVLDPNDLTRVVGVLDWEMATLGDPLMDLGNSLAYWVQADDDFVVRSIRRQPTHLPGMLTRQELVAAYCDRMGLAPKDWTFYEVYGLFRLGVIIQQIAYRHHLRQTRNPAFRRFWLLVHYLNWRCRRLITTRTFGFLLLLSLALPGRYARAADEPMTYVYHPPESSLDVRRSYAPHSNGRIPWGPYRMIPSAFMTEKRQALELESATGPAGSEPSKRSDG